MATATSAAHLCRNFVNGRWVESKSTKIVERRNPANTDEVVATIPLSTREEMKEAIAEPTEHRFDGGFLTAQFSQKVEIHSARERAPDERCQPRTDFE